MGPGRSALVKLLPVFLAALLSGCVLVEKEDDAGDDPVPGGGFTHGPGPGFAPQQGTAHGSNGGIDVNVTWEACDAGFCANATATNRGSQTVRISSICESPWTDRMTHDGEAVAHREPQFTCLAYGRADFAPGATSQANFTWDGRIHEDGGASRPAPEGAYTWSIVFWWDDGAGGARQEAAADIQLVVGET